MLQELYVQYHHETEEQLYYSLLFVHMIGPVSFHSRSSLVWYD